MEIAFALIAAIAVIGCVAVMRNRLKIGSAHSKPDVARPEQN